MDELISDLTPTISEDEEQDYSEPVAVWPLDEELTEQEMQEILSDAWDDEDLEDE